MGVKGGFCPSPTPALSAIAPGIDASVGTFSIVTSVLFSVLPKFLLLCVGCAESISEGWTWAMQRLQLPCLFLWAPFAEEQHKFPAGCSRTRIFMPAGLCVFPSELSALAMYFTHRRERPWLAFIGRQPSVLSVFALLIPYLHLSSRQF